VAKLSELFAGAPATARPTVRTAPPEEATAKTGTPPAANRYGNQIPLTDQFAGRTLAQLLQNAGDRIDPQTYVARYVKPEKPPLYSGMWGSEKLYMRSTGGGLEGLPTAEQLTIITTAEAQDWLAGKMRGQTGLPGSQGGLLA
jgi:hypothetical protein